MAFKKGQSGNPAGKPRGAKDKRTELRELLRPHQSEIVTKVVDLAKAGDTTAIRLVLERICPPLRAGDIPVSIPLSGGSLTERAESLLAAVCSGTVGPEQGGKLLDMLVSFSKVMEIDHLSERIAAVERTISDITGETQREA